MPEQIVDTTNSVDSVGTPLWKDMFPGARPAMFYWAND